jgi:hypothetical protein
MRARTALAAGAVDLLAGHEGCGVPTQLSVVTAARGEQGRCCSCWRAMYRQGQETVQKDSLRVSVEVGFVNFHWAALFCDWAQSH